MSMMLQNLNTMLIVNSIYRAAFDQIRRNKQDQEEREKSEIESRPLCSLHRSFSTRTEENPPVRDFKETEETSCWLYDACLLTVCIVAFIGMLIFISTSK